MTTKKTQKPKKKQRRGVPDYFVDQKGDNVPKKYVQDYDMERQLELESVVKGWLAERERLEKLLERTMESATYLEGLRGTAMAERGNMQITSFDGLMQLEITTAWNIVLDDRAIEAKHAMVAYLKKSLGDVKTFEDHQAILAVIEDTFTPTKGGCLRNAMVVRLLNFKILAQEWQDACTKLRAAMQTIRGKSYLRVNTRPSIQGEWQMIRLDINSCFNDEDENES